MCVFHKVMQSNYPTIRSCRTSSNPHYYYLEAALFASEDYHLLANAANKFWNLIDL